MILLSNLVPLSHVVPFPHSPMSISSALVSSKPLGADSGGGGGGGHCWRGRRRQLPKVRQQTPKISTHKSYSHQTTF